MFFETFFYGFFSLSDINFLIYIISNLVNKCHN
nr:MAG TPA: hypothetical protein [Caudoviricetes sp.]